MVPASHRDPRRYRSRRPADHQECPMSIAVTLAPRLAIERIRATRGAGVLDAMAVLAFTVSSWLALTVAGGTWMFLQRWRVEGVLPNPQQAGLALTLSLIHISEPTRLGMISYAVF